MEFIFFFLCSVVYLIYYSFHNYYNKQNLLKQKLNQLVSTDEKIYVKLNTGADWLHFCEVTDLTDTHVVLNYELNVGKKKVKGERIVKLNSITDIIYSNEQEQINIVEKLNKLLD